VYIPPPEPAMGDTVRGSMSPISVIEDWICLYLRDEAHRRLARGQDLVDRHQPGYRHEPQGDLAHLA
jgi:hypothetical protein